MRTTLDLPEDVLRSAKTHAAQHDRTLKDVVADALRAALAAPIGASAAHQELPPAAGSVSMRRGLEGEPASRRSKAHPNRIDASTPAAQRRRRFDALLAQIDLVPDRQDATDPLAWDDQGLPR